MPARSPDVPAAMVTAPPAPTHASSAATSRATAGEVLREHDLPIMLMDDAAVRANVELMANYCAARDVRLAPHAKTSMSSYVSRLQLDAGSWGLTVATVRQAKQILEVGVDRILLANVLVEPQGIRWVADTFLRQDENCEFLCYVDSLAGVELLESQLRSLRPTRPLDVLVELGFRGGRTGARGVIKALEVAEAASNSPLLRLRGIAGFEGLMPREGELVPPQLPGYLHELRTLSIEANLRSLLPSEPVISAGGSAYFDLVVDQLDVPGLGFDAQIVLRSGCYVTHDHGSYRLTSPLDGRGTSDRRLQPALELVAAVLSRPEPGLVIAGFGRREAPTDDGLPLLLGTVDALTGQRAAAEGTVVMLNDHHAFLEVPADSPLMTGDLLRFGIAHPCGAFDRWRAIPVVDTSYRILDITVPWL